MNHRLPPIYRLSPPAVAEDVPGRRDDNLARLEAVLWLADEPLSARKLAQAAGLGDAATARQLVQRLQDLLAADDSAFQIEHLAGGYQLLTRPEFYPWLVRLRRTGSHDKLSAALLETLAVVAYKQPVMRADVEAIRGVHCGEALRQLMERKLVQIVGRHDSLGRPVLYGTTKRFLQMFGLQELSELPPVGN
jgi:segregation and condensation protein B